MDLLSERHPAKRSQRTFESLPQALVRASSEGRPQSYIHRLSRCRTETCHSVFPALEEHFSSRGGCKQEETAEAGHADPPPCCQDKSMCRVPASPVELHKVCLPSTLAILVPSPASLLESEEEPGRRMFDEMETIWSWWVNIKFL
ncbi:hypothetical protein C0Q70_19174 [Pomacea canaliculata]|uniref:Uncharacterized protein n=1 Tax=Pomacea canaliculata TaxID=400727 RepID=A0A2T7NIN1_POMCA|nr:hypothetical protein C0Q70_19174 [Pomacea canaliculata]